MRADRSPFPLGWLGVSLAHVGLERVRPKVGTYGRYDYARLPPLPLALNGDFEWLARAPVQDEWPIGPEEDRAQTAERSGRLLDAEPRLPDELTTFLRTPTLHNRIRSATACYLDICACSVPAPNVEGRLVRFLCDQQGCCFWYVYLAPDGDHAVTVSGTHYGAPDESQDDGPEDTMIFVAESFEAFLCRYWLENEIAFCREPNELPPAARAYVEAYRQAA